MIMLSWYSKTSLLPLKRKRLGKLEEILQLSICFLRLSTPSEWERRPTAESAVVLGPPLVQQGAHTWIQLDRCKSGCVHAR